ncbi:MAG: tRNA-dihydrouridine synthase family protein [Planctomycetota bacterium]
MIFHTTLPILAPLTKGGNLPFRRLCIDLGAEITMSEMAYSRQVVRGSKSEMALLRKHASEGCFGVQLASGKPEEAVKAAKIAADRGAAFVDLNCGCPIHDVVRRGMGATLLRRPAALARIVAAMVEAVDVPVTVKLRSGWSEGKDNALEIGRAVQEAGAAAVTLHARAREQRYTKAANWELIGEMVSTLSIPVIGNGDLLTHYEVRRRQRESGCAAVMLGRGALIKPWLFREVAEGREIEPAAAERVAIYARLVRYLKEHFREDEKGRERTMRFLPWHFDFFCRYRPLPEAEWRERAKEHPLLQTRIPDEEGLPLLERVLRDPRPEVHQRLADELWACDGDEDAVARFEAVGQESPPEAGEHADVKVAHG